MLDRESALERLEVVVTDGALDELIYRSSNRAWDEF
jgi:hypothetical protein